MSQPASQMKKIAIFGSARIQSHTPEYEAAVAVGRSLAQAGYVVMTGGYDGVMGAASKGASEVGGHVLGVTVAHGVLPGELIPNQWLVERIEFPTLRLRLQHLVDEAHGYVIMPGGVGTLQEVGDTWQHLRTCSIKKPMIAYGAMWRQVLQPLAESAYVTPDAVEMLAFCETPEQVVAVIDKVLGA